MGNWVTGRKHRPASCRRRRLGAARTRTSDQNPESHLKGRTLCSLGVRCPAEVRLAPEADTCLGLGNDPI